MHILVFLGFSLIIGWMVKKFLTRNIRPQVEDLKKVSFGQQRPRALSYTKMMNSGKQRLGQTSTEND